MLFTQSIVKRYQAWITCLKSSRGFSITEVLVGIGLLGILVVAGSSFLPNLTATRNRIEAISARDGIVINIRRALARSNLVTSAQTYSAAPYTDSGNVELLKCIDGNQATLCTATNINSPSSIRLGSMMGQAPVHITGSDAYPLLYNHQSRICSNNPSQAQQENCKAVWDVRSYFVAVCNGNAASCGEAIAIRLRFQVTYVPDPNRPSDPPLPSLPASDQSGDFDHWSGSLWVQLLPPTQTSQCSSGNNSIMVGADQNGKAICVCQPGTSQTGQDASGSPICSAPAAVTCPAGQRLIGFDNDFKAKCQPSANANCYRITNSSGCLGYVAEVAMGVCTVPNTYKKGTYAATCTQNQYLCCEN